MLDDMLEILARIRRKLQNLSWNKVDVDAFLKDLEGSELLTKFDAGELDPQAWESLKKCRNRNGQTCRS